MSSDHPEIDEDRDDLGLTLGELIDQLTTLYEKHGTAIKVRVEGCDCIDWCASAAYVNKGDDTPYVLLER